MFFRKRIYILSLVASLMTGLLFVSGCDFLETEPPGTLSEATFWQTEEDLRVATNDLYNYLYGQLQFDLSALSDEATPNWSFDNMATFARGQQTSTTQFGNSWWPSWWASNYSGIRAANEVIARSGDIQGDQQTIDRFVAEARFMRAYLYMMQTFLFGDVPLITEPISLEEAQDVTRTSQEEVWDFVSSEFQAASEVLPESYSGGNQGRATRGAALGMKARAMLYAGRYQEAMQAAQAVMNLGEYSLYPNYEELFTPEAEYNSEVILNKDFVKNTHSNQVLEFLAPASLVSGRGQNFNVPTKRLVDAYEMENGMPIDAAGSGFDPRNPYEDRDPRLDYSVFVYGDTLPNGSIYDPRPGFGGADDIEAGFQTTDTGFNVEKYVNEECLGDQYNCGVNVIEMRYAEILLIYAEAKIEMGDIDQSVYDAINQVRQRPDVDMPPIEIGKSQEELRQIVRHERLVELAFEGQRFFDVRRWGIAEDVLNGPIYGMRYVDQDGNLQTVTFDPFERTFESNHYLWPIPQKEIDLLDIQQNPGY